MKLIKQSLLFLLIVLICLIGINAYQPAEMYDTEINGTLEVNNVSTLLSTSITGGLNISGNLIVTNGQVGIGVTNPLYTLHVNGGALFNGSATFLGNTSILNVSSVSLNGSMNPAITDTFSIGNGTHTWKNITIGTGDSVFGGALSIGGDLSLENGELIDNSIDDIINFTGVGGTTNQWVAIDLDETYRPAISASSGSLGFDAGVTMRFGNSFTIFNSVNTKFYSLSHDGTDASIIVGAGDGGMKLGTEGVADIYMYNGEVGIGVADPQYRLDITDDAVPLQVTRDTTVTSSRDIIEVMHNTTANMDDSIRANIAFEIADNTMATGNIIGRVGAIRDGDDSSGKLWFGADNGNGIHAVLSADGHFGVGIEDPNYRLDINSGNSNNAFNISSDDPGVTGFLCDDENCNQISTLTDGRFVFQNTSGSQLLRLENDFVDVNTELKIADIDTGGNAGDPICIDANSKVCECNSCA